MAAHAHNSRPGLLISLSGLDGAGKSTQIEALTALLESWDYRVRRLAFWDHVVVFTRYRESFVHKVFHSEQGIGAPGKPVHRRDKNVRAWHLTLARHFLYLLDALHLCWVVARERRSQPDAIIMDRYIYDELANLPLQNPFSRWFIRMVAGLAPRPDLALLLDADPEAARVRKPEYPAEFMRECRGWYHELASLLRWITVIPPLSLPDARRAVALALRRTLAVDYDQHVALQRPAA